MAKDYLGMSDEDFLKEPVPPIEESNINPPAEPETTEVTPPPAEEVIEVVEPEVNPKVENQDEVIEPEVVPPVETPENPEEVTPPAETQVEPQTQENPPENNEPDYKALYESLTSPIKANGREITLDKVEDFRRLVSMGMNYTQKMQELAPQRRLLATLEKYGLADEARLNYLIDLSQKNPAAVQHLLRESGINPMEIDQENAPQYIPGSHGVSDNEAIFRSSVQELSGSQAGQKTLQTIQAYDEASRQMVFDHPGVIREIHEAQANGTYDIVANEVERLRILGYIKPEVPFLAAFQHVGQQMQEQQNTSQVAQQQQMVQTKPVTQAVQTQPIAVAPRNSVQPQTGQNNSRVAAAASTRTANTVGTKTQPNWLNMSDEEFMNHHNQHLRNS